MTKQKTAVLSKITLVSIVLIGVSLLFSFFIGRQYEARLRAQYSTPMPDAYMIDNVCYSKALGIKVALPTNYFNCVFDAQNSGAGAIMRIKSDWLSTNTGESGLGLVIAKSWGTDFKPSNCPVTITTINLGFKAIPVKLCTDQSGTKVIQQWIPTSDNPSVGFTIVGGPYKVVTNTDIQDLKSVLDSISLIDR